MWDPPQSLDLDIVYCVEVYEITDDKRELVDSDCNVTETSYISDVISPGRYNYEFVVTPRSNVEGAVNGSSKTLSSKCCRVFSLEFK